MRLLELFGGIGACSAALKRLGIDVEIADYVEIDKYAVQSYNAINGTNFEPQDITKWDKDIDVDMIMHGSPCQDFSLAGYQRGGDKGSGTRSSLMYETIRIVDKLNPKYVVWENVKNLLSKKHKHNFDAYLEALDELGYNNYYQVLNAKDYGIPQNRERVFTISIRKDIDTESYIFPEKQVLKLRLKDMLEEDVDEKYYLSEKMIQYISFTGTKNFKNPDCRINLDIARPLTTDQGKRAGTTNYISEELPDNFDLRVIRKYGVFDKDGKTHQAGSVYDVNGGYRQPCIEETDKIIKAGHLNYKTGNDKEHQSNVIVDEDGIAPTLYAGQYKNPLKILVKNNTKKGYQEAYEGDSINLQRLGSTTRRGRVGNQVAQTLDTQCEQGVVVKVPLKRGYSVEVRPELFDTTEIDIIGNYSKSDYNATPIVGKNGVAPTVRENHGQVTAITTKNKRIQKIVEDNDLSDKDPSFLDIYNQKVVYNECGTLKAGMDHQQGNIIYSQLRIRKLTPKECWRLMGFSDENFDKAEAIGISNTQLYKQAGNSIVVDVLYYIFANLFHIKINDENLEIRKDTKMYFNNSQNKRNLKTNIITLDELFDIEKLITKNPQLYAELCEKYPVKKECIYIIQYAHPEVKENVSETPKATEEAPVSLEDNQESSKVQMSSIYGEIKAKDKNVENSGESVAENVENNVENSTESSNDFPEDFLPLYSVGEKITISYSYGEITEHITIKKIDLSYNEDNTPNKYYYTYEVDESGEVKTMAEDFLVDHEVTK